MRRLMTNFLNGMRRRFFVPRRHLREPLTITVTLPPPAVVIRHGVAAETGEKDSAASSSSSAGSAYAALRETPVLKGRVRDLSRTGIAFIVPMIRLGDNYLVGENKVLSAEIHLPDESETKKIALQIVGQRYRPLNENSTAAAAVEYLIGARIIWMSEADRQIYADYLGGRGKSAPRAGGDEKKRFEFSATGSRLS